MLLEEFLRPMGVSQRQFAAKLGWTTAKLNELVKGKRGMTADTALDLAKALGTSPEIWMNLQAMWDGSALSDTDQGDTAWPPAARSSSSTWRGRKCPTSSACAATATSACST